MKKAIFVTMLVCVLSAFASVFSANINLNGMRSITISEAGAYLDDCIIVTCTPQNDQTLLWTITCKTDEVVLVNVIFTNSKNEVVKTSATLSANPVKGLARSVSVVSTASGK